jgi:hypothetical protein
MFQNGMCADVQDRVYAILALLPRGQQFPVHYSISREELFCSTVMASFVTARITSSMHEGSQALTEFILEGHVGLDRGEINVKDMETIYTVAKSLGISFGRLQAYPESERDLGVCVSMAFTITHPANPQLSDKVPRHSYELSGVSLSLSP